MPKAYYNENEPYAAAWLANLIAAGLIMDGDVDDRDIRDVEPEDLQGYTRCHFFAGIAGWDLALQLAGWPAERPVWTGSCPCPPFSAAGKKKSCPACQSRNLIPHPYETGTFVCCECGHTWHADGRHLWPEFHRLIWLAGVHATLEILGYDVWRTDLPAASVGAPHRRQRLWFMADAECMRCDAGKPGDGRGQTRSKGPYRPQPDRCGVSGGVGVSGGDGRTQRPLPGQPWRASRPQGPSAARSGPWSEYDVVWCDERTCGRGWAPRRVEPGTCPRHRTAGRGEIHRRLPRKGKKLSERSRNECTQRRPVFGSQAVPEGGYSAPLVRHDRAGP